MRLSNNSKLLLNELLKYNKKYGVKTFGIFIRSTNEHDIVFHYKDETFKFSFVGLSVDELSLALRELNKRYLYYSVNMQYLITLID